MNKPSYNKEAVKKLTFEKFKKLHEHIEYFTNLDDEGWVKEYESITGNKIKKGE